LPAHPELVRALVLVEPGDFEKAGAEVRRMLLSNVRAFELDYNSRRLPFTREDARRVAVPLTSLLTKSARNGLKPVTRQRRQSAIIRGAPAKAPARQIDSSIPAGEMSCEAFATSLDTKR